ncbi:MAG TPA: ATP-binding protein [Cyclobacteriaceae bacterium]|nr:ATP-binding protein [Cyclobacteriaceae bacterium]
MGFENFRLNVVVRIFTLSIILLALVYCVYESLYLRSVYVVIALIISIIELIRYVDKTNRDLTNFFLAISQKDFTTTYSEQGKGASFSKLYSALNHITNQFRSISEEKEAQYIFLSLLVEQIRVGILSVDQHGEIHLINQTMKRFLANPNVKNLDDLEVNDGDLAAAFRDAKPGDSHVVKKTIDGKIAPLTMLVSEISIRDKHFKLISVQDIRNELEANELEAWQRLIRVLTHEIMNSVSPIISLTATLSKLVTTRNEAKVGFSDPDRNTLQKGMEAILSRSKGLHHFADAYRSLTRLPQPQFQEVSVSDFIEKLLLLFDEEIKQKGISVSRSADPHLKMTADPELLEQVFINILKNAIEATDGQPSPTIAIDASLAMDNRVIIMLRDNGPGIEKDVLDKIFIPFFTTKKSGTGIGLPLSKQIVQIHRGELSIQSEVNAGCVVRLVI